jgi:hypothetical protein
MNQNLKQNHDHLAELVSGPVKPVEKDTQRMHARHPCFTR